ncbi:MAG: arylsulfatase [Isosphaeraceae bacterium]
MFAFAIVAALACSMADRPNVVVILADDIGYGDLGCYGATRVSTPNVDRLAKGGLRFRDGHASAATCTPSRFALMTGKYAFRQQGTNILPGDAALILDPDRLTLPKLFREAGYRTGVVGKWHLGLGKGGDAIDWNGPIAPGPREVGFDSSFIIPATGDRTPCVYVEDGRVVGLDPGDPIRVGYAKPVGDEPTGKAHPELLKTKSSHGHDQTIVNGIGRIGTMTGGKAARWVDEEMADTLARKAVAFVESSRDRPFFLYLATHHIHVPRVPHPRYAGKTDMGPRGDAIVEFDATVGAVLDALDRLKLADDTLVILSSDNGPVVDDGYQDEAVKRLGDHRPAGPLRGGKYSLFEGGTRVPFLARWPKRIRPGTSDALVCQVDLFASLAQLLDRKLPEGTAPDSEAILPALLGESARGRDELVHQGARLALRQGPWKYIPPGPGPAVQANTNVESGNAMMPQLYDLRADLGETRNLAAEHPDRVEAMAARLKEIREKP